MKNKKKILIGIVLLLLLVGVIVGVYFFVLKKEKKQINDIEGYGIEKSYIIKENINNLSKHNYIINKDGKSFVYDYNNKELLSVDSGSYLVELDNKYILINKSNSEVHAIYDINGKEIYNNNKIIEIFSKDSRYFIIDNKLYNYDLKEIYEFKNEVSLSDYININDYLLYTTDAKKNICVDLSNGKTLAEGYDNVIATGDYVIFHKDNKYQMFNKNELANIYDKVDYLSFYYDFMSFDNHTLLLKLTSGEKVEYLIEGKIVSTPEIKINDYVIDLGMCSTGGKVKKDNKVVIDNCLYDVNTSKNIIIGYDSDTGKSKLYINNKDLSKESAQYEIFGDYAIETDIDTGNSVVYNNSGKVVGDYYLTKYGSIYVKNKNGQYFMNEKLEEISPRYNEIFCNSITNYCIVANDEDNYALFYKDKKLTDFIYSSIELNDNTILLNDGIVYQVLILDKQSKNRDIPKIDYSEINNIDIKKIKEENGLNFEIPSEYEDLFKKYAYVVENNKNIKNYKSYVYDLFQIIMKKNIYPYLNEPYFFDKLGKLSITVKESIANVGVGGYYYDGSVSVEIDKEYSESTYHELVHFLDFTINKDNNYEAWICNNKLINRQEYNNLLADNKKSCISVETSDLKSDIVTEAGAELYSAKYFKKGIVAYHDITAYLTGLEYIIGSEKMDEIFLAKNSGYNFMKLFIDNGFTLEEFKKFNADFSKYTYPLRNSNHEFTGRAIDALIDLYKIYKKDRNWQEDEEFKYIIKAFLDMYINDKYKNSKYKDELSKIAYKSFDSYKKYENELLKGLPKDIEFGTSPIPPYIIDNTLYLGTKINGSNKMFGYIRYDFYNKKIIDYKYPIEIR